MFFGYDLTGVSWSPIVAAVVGSYFINVAQKKDAQEKTVT